MASGNNFFKNWPKPPTSPPIKQYEWPAVPKDTIEREIRSYASGHSVAGTVRLFLNFMLKTKAFIFMSGVRGTATPSQAALTRLSTLIETATKKPTDEAVIDALFEALAYLKANYQSLFPNNRRIGAYDPKTSKLAPSSLVDPDEYFISKWRKIAEGGDYDREGSESEKRLAKLTYVGGRRTARRTQTSQKGRKATRRRRRSMRH